MSKFRKKPVVIEAEQYKEYGILVKGMCNSRSCFTAGNKEPHVHTIHNNQIVLLEVGDFIIPEPDGEHYYPCKPDIFEATYEFEPEPDPTMAAPTFEYELRDLINRYSKENGSDTPDFILSDYLKGCLENYDETLKAREMWYGRDLKQVAMSRERSQEIAATGNNITP